MDQGHLLEQLIAEFSSRFFLLDFVYLNPKYYKSGNEKELGDLLLVLNDKCIVVSVKGTPKEDRADDKLRSWLAKRLAEGSKQAKGGINSLSKVSFVARNLWGDLKEFPAGSLTPLCGLVLLECPQKLLGSFEFPVQLPQSMVPIHFLSVNDFLNVINWSGSISDVFTYLSKRSALAHLFTGINQEQPIFAYYALESQDLVGIETADRDDLIRRHNRHLIENLGEYEKRTRFADRVNYIAHQLHDRDETMEDYIPEEFKKYVEPADDRVSYLKIATILNSLPISNKVKIGQMIEEMLKKPSNSIRMRAFAFKRQGDRFVFVFAGFYQRSRTERVTIMYNLLLAALYRHEVREGLVVGFDAEDFESGLDLNWLRMGDGDFDEDTKKLGHRLFPAISEVKISDEFGNEAE